MVTLERFLPLKSTVNVIIYMSSAYSGIVVGMISKPNDFCFVALTGASVTKTARPVCFWRSQKEYAYLWFIPEKITRTAFTVDVASIIGGMRLGIEDSEENWSRFMSI